MVGGSTPAERNIVSANAFFGVEIQGSSAGGNQVRGNYIGTDAGGTVDLGNDADGVLIFDSPGNTVGGMGAWDGNVIAGNFTGVRLEGAGANHTNVWGNLIGTNAAGTGAIPNGVGVSISNANENVVGGTTAGARNVISGNADSGITISGSATDNGVRGNYVGVAANGTDPLPNDNGIDVNAPGNTIGSSAPGSGNVISGNTAWGIRLVTSAASNNTVRRNFIGTDATGTVAVPNGTEGILLDFATGNAIGGMTVAEGNTIAYNDGIGVLAGSDAIGNPILVNSIHSNGGLGIDLTAGGGSFGPTPNDVGDGDTGGNNLQNFPVLTGAISVSGNTEITGWFNSTPNSDFTFRFYASAACDPSGFGEGDTFVGQLGLGTDPSGDIEAFTADLAVGLALGTQITATATDAAGNTSEFSACVTTTADPQTLTVTTTAGSGPGSLRQAILLANATAVPDTIAFDIPGVGPQTIAPLSPLPALTETVTIDGATQPGFGPLPVIEIEGSSAGAGANGLWVAAPNSVVRALFINRFAAAGVRLEGDNGLLEFSGIGVDVTGTVALGNTIGVEVLGTDASIGHPSGEVGNVISGNTSYGVLIHPGASRARLAGNMIGTNVDGTAALGNGADGVRTSAVDTLIGDPEAGGSDGNIISGNGGFGVFLDGSTAARVAGNAIGLGDNDVAVPNGGGVSVVSAPGTVIGSPTFPNTISGNAGAGVVISGSVVPAAVLQGNRIGTDGTGTAARPNTSTGVHIEHGSTDNVIGGIGAGEGNLISGNGGTGLAIRGDGTRVEGNLFGTAAAGLAALSNAGYGIHIEFGQFNTVGGPTVAHRNIVSGNAVGIFLGGSLPFLPTPTTGNRVEGNYIGVDATGAVALPNGTGVDIRESANLTVVTDNVISGNASRGVSIIEGATNNTVANNRIGTDEFGTVAVGNAEAGVFVSDASTNTIGGSDPADRNVISANFIGVTIQGAGATGNVIAGNFVGTDVTGTLALGNARSAIVIQDAPGNTIGGTTPAVRNVLSANGDNGVEIRGAAATGNLIQGNYIGTDVSGGLDLGNGRTGIRILAGAANTTVGGTAVGAGNVIAGNGDPVEGFLASGVLVDPLGVPATGNVIQGNYIGTDAAGTSALPNTAYGIHIIDSAGNTIGGTVAGARNIISASGLNGVNVQGAAATGNLIQGNLIGTDVSGTVGLGNAAMGVWIEAPDTVLGGSTPAARNVISANGNVGVLIQNAVATGNLVQGNYIGTDASGTMELGNAASGVIIGDAATNTIGGPTAAERNVISGNGGTGVEITGATSTGNVVQSNYIGVDAGGTVAVPNNDGVNIRQNASLTMVTDNVISGNTFAGVSLIEGADSTRIESNRIGTDASGTAAVGNGDAGVSISDATNNTIGGPTAGQRNVISANALRGVEIQGVTATGNVLQGNYIGTDATGVGALWNGDDGVRINDAPGNTIGGAGAGEGNVIAFNVSTSVLITGATAVGNTVRGNTIHDGGDGQIDLGADGVTPNDPGDVDTGPNNLQNFPVITSATSDGATTTISVTLNSTPNTTFAVELFASPLCLSMGQTLVHTNPVLTTDGAGDAAFVTDVPGGPAVGEVITATATDTAGNTSEFSECVAVTDPPATGTLWFNGSQVSAWTQNTAQQFSVTVDLGTQSASLNIDGIAVASSVPFFQSTAELATVNMEMGGTGTQILAWDDVVVSGLSTIFSADFNSDVVGSPPGSPAIGAWTVLASNGSVLVRSSSGDLTNQPVELEQFGGVNNVTLRGTVTTAPTTGTWTVTWRSLMNTPGSQVITTVALRDTFGTTLAVVAYLP